MSDFISFGNFEVIKISILALLVLTLATSYSY